MNKSDLVSKVAEKVEITKKDAAVYVESILSSISNALVDGDKVQLSGFGTFEVRDRKERVGRNPQNPTEEIIIPASKAPAFKAAKGLKEAVNE